MGLLHTQAEGIHKVGMLLEEAQEIDARETYTTRGVAWLVECLSSMRKAMCDPQCHMKTNCEEKFKVIFTYRVRLKSPWTA